MSGAHSTLGGLGSGLSVGTTQQILLTTKDKYGNDGEYDVYGASATVTSAFSLGAAVLPTTTVNNLDGTYSVLFRTTVTGSYTFSVMLGIPAVHAAGSPRTIQMLGDKPSASNLLVECDACSSGVAVAAGNTTQPAYLQ